MLVLKEGIGDGTEFVMDTLRYFEPVEGTEVRSDMMVFWDFTDNTGKVILDMLKAGYLIGGKVKVEGVAVIEFGVDKRSGNGFDGVEVEGGTDAPKIMDEPVAGFTDRGDLVAEGEMTVEKDTEITCSVDWLDDCVLIDLE